MMLDSKTKKILDGFKNSSYDLFKITKKNENRIDLILYDIYENESYKQYYQIFSYLNDIVYPQDEYVVGRYIKVYNLEEIDILLTSYGINISEQIFF